MAENSDARDSLDRAKKILSEPSNVQILDQKTQLSKTRFRQKESARDGLLSGSRTRADSSSMRPLLMTDSTSNQATDEKESSHQLVRRFTEDLDNDRILIELKRA